MKDEGKLLAVIISLGVSAFLVCAGVALIAWAVR